MTETITLEHIHDDVLALRKEIDEIKATVTSSKVEHNDLSILMVSGKSFDFLNDDEELYSEKDLVERYT